MVKAANSQVALRERRASVDAHVRRASCMQAGLQPVHHTPVVCEDDELARACDRLRFAHRITRRLARRLARRRLCLRLRLRLLRLQSLREKEPHCGQLDEPGELILALVGDRIASIDVPLGSGFGFIGSVDKHRGGSVQSRHPSLLLI